MRVQMDAEKFCGKSIDGEYVTKKYRVLSLNDEEVALVLWWADHFDWEYDSVESYYNLGLWSGGEDCVLDYVDVSKLLYAIEKRLVNEFWFDEEEIPERKDEVKVLEKYRGYILHIKRR